MGVIAMVEDAIPKKKQYTVGISGGLMNSLRRMICPTPEEEEEDRQKINKIIQRMKNDKHCSFCVHAEEHPHYEMGYEAGSYTYCTVLNELRLSYPTGEQCVFWQLNE